MFNIISSIHISQLSYNFLISPEHLKHLNLLPDSTASTLESNQLIQAQIPHYTNTRLHAVITQPLTTEVLASMGLAT